MSRTVGGAVKIPGPSDRAVRALQALLPSDPRVSVRKVFGLPAAFVNGNMFLGVFGEDVFVRLSEPEGAELTQTAGGRPFEPMPGRAMKGYHTLPAAMRDHPKAAAPWVKRALAHAGSLPPKTPKKGQ
jgi:TfoX/Sxy family transcriptional regulator of competence genes